MRPLVRSVFLLLGLAATTLFVTASIVSLVSPGSFDLPRGVVLVVSVVALVVVIAALLQAFRRER